MEDVRVIIPIIREICKEKDIEFSVHSYNWVIQLKKNDRIVHICGNRFDLNGESAGRIVCDKFATYCVLSSFNIPACECKMIFNPAMRSDYIPEKGNCSLIYEEFLKYGKLVVKPNDGCEGINVFLCNSMKEVEIAVEKIFKTNPSLSICPYYDIQKEYRAFYLDGEVKLIYEKERPFVVGDGKNTLGELVEKLDLPKNSVVEDNLKKLNLKSVPKKDEIVYLSWKHNLSGGALPKVIEKGEEYNRVEALAKESAKAVNIKFATIDIIKTTDGDYKVLEINSGVSGTLFIKNTKEGYAKMKQIYSEAIDLMFK